jgi:hypothetical protein
MQITVFSNSFALYLTGKIVVTLFSTQVNLSNLT